MHKTFVKTHISAWGDTFFVAVHKYFMCAPKSAQLKSWLVDHNHSHYILVLNSNFSMNTECPHCQLAFRGEKGLAVHLNWSASCKSASQSLRHQELRLLNVNPAITTTPAIWRHHETCSHARWREGCQLPTIPNRKSTTMLISVQCLKTAAGTWGERQTTASTVLVA